MKHVYLSIHYGSDSNSKMLEFSTRQILDFTIYKLVQLKIMTNLCFHASLVFLVKQLPYTALDISALDFFYKVIQILRLYDRLLNKNISLARREINEYKLKIYFLQNYVI